MQRAVPVEAQEDMSLDLQYRTNLCSQEFGNDLRLMFPILKAHFLPYMLCFSLFYLIFRCHIEETIHVCWKLSGRNLCCGRTGLILTLPHDSDD
jgi:hypothetical protein